jgi:transitional endoplasmic reticulum ATPase
MANELRKAPAQPEGYDWMGKDIEIKREGTKIVLPNTPEPMDYRAARSLLKRAEDAENMIYDINEVVPVHFFDGLVALFYVLKEKFGYAGTQTKKIETFFGPIAIPPKLIHVRVGPKPHDVVQVPFGQFSFPNVEGAVETVYAMHNGIPALALKGQVKSNERQIILEIVQEVRERARHNSIYKGRSITLERSESKGVDYNKPLEFFDPSEGDLFPIFNKETETLIETTLLAPIKNSDLCREKRIPLKRGILLEGPYGTGKTLTARQSASIANQHGWTFIHVTASQALKYALEFAKIYQPCIIFAEDVDRVAENRNEGANDLINEIDGIVGKKDEIITVLTTNHADKIEKSMLRPGRLDAVISLRPPEPDTVQRLIRHYAGSEMAADVDLTATAAVLAGQIPAVIREVVERAKLAMIVRGEDKIGTEALKATADSMKNHLDLMDNAKEGDRAPSIDQLFSAMVEARVKEVIRDQIDSDYLNAE